MSLSHWIHQALPVDGSPERAALRELGFQIAAELRRFDEQIDALRRTSERHEIRIEQLEKAARGGAA